MEVGSKILDMRERVPVVFRSVVEAAKIPAGPPRPIWLGYHVEGRRPRAVRSSDNSILQQLVERLTRTGKSLGAETPGLGEDWSSAGRHGVHNAVCVAVVSEPRLLNFGELLEEALEFSRGIDDLE